MNISNIIDNKKLCCVNNIYYIYYDRKWSIWFKNILSSL